MKRLLAIVLCAFMLMTIMPMGFAQNAEAEEKSQNKSHSSADLSRAANRYGSSLTFTGDWDIEYDVTRYYGKSDVLVAYSDGTANEVSAIAKVTKGDSVSFYYNYFLVGDSCTFNFSYINLDDNTETCLINNSNASVTGSWASFSHAFEESGWYKLIWRFTPDSGCTKGALHYAKIDDVYVGGTYDMGVVSVGEDFSTTISDVETDATVEVSRGYIPDGCEIAVDNSPSYTEAVLIGKPTCPGTYEYTIKFVDKVTHSTAHTGKYFMTVLPSKPDDVTVLDTGYVERFYSAQLEQFTDTVYTDLEIVAGKAPKGMSDFNCGSDGIGSDFVISGEPLEKGYFFFTVKYTKEDGITSCTRAYECEVTPPTDTVFYEDFEEGIDNWKTVDLDGDGYNWESSALTSYEGNLCLKSDSYVIGVGPLVPDNLIISPEFKVEKGSYLSWYDCAQNPSFTKESYSVYLGTGTDISNYTLLTDFMTTKNWSRREVNLSDYAGQTLSIAFRHCDTTDQFALKIDLVSATKGEEEPLEVINQVDITDADITPIAGELAGDHLDYTIPTGAKYSCTAHMWYDETNNADLYDDNVFVAGNSYSTCWGIKAESGYVFDENTAFTINGSDVAVDMSYSAVDEDDNTLCVIWTKPTNAVKMIESVAVNGADLTPVVGDMAGDHIGYTLPDGADYKCEFSYWYDETESKTLVDGDIFAADHEYSVCFIMRANEGCCFSEATTATINNDTDNVDFVKISDADNTLMYVWAKPAYAVNVDRMIESVAIDNLNLLIMADSSVGAQFGFTLPDGADYKCESGYWYDDTDNKVLTDEDIFVEGHEYSVCFIMRSNAGYYFGESTTVTINNDTDSIDLVEIGAIDKTIMYIWTKPVKAVGLAPENHTVTFVDGVTGETISTVTVEHGKDAELPTAPEHEGYIFKGWDSDGKNIVADTTITAQYLLLGDTNFDGTVNTGDAVMILRSCVGLVELSDDQKLAADMSGDGKINTGDAVAVLRFYVGLKDA